MSKSPRKRIEPTKKHLARIEKEKLQTRYLLIGSMAVLVIVLGLIGYGILDQTVLQDRRVVAIVNGEKIIAADFKAQTRYARYTMVVNAMQVYQLAQMFASDPASASSFVSQLQQIQALLVPTNIGDQVLNKMIDDILIRQEAERRGITVTEEEIQKAFEAAFQYFPEGTPTRTPTSSPIPTSTLSPLQLTLMPPTPTTTFTPTLTPTLTLSVTQSLTLTEVPTATPTQTSTPTATPVPTETPIPTPTLTSTPYTYEAYQELLQQTLTQFKEEYDITLEDLRYVIETQLYREKVMNAILADLPHTQEKVWALHILVEDETLANDIYNRLMEGEDWYLMASTYSTDTSNKDKGGNLGWFARGQMVPEFEEVAFSLAIGETSKPVKSQFGWHIIRVLGHEERPISETEYAQLRIDKFQEWLDSQRESASIEIRDFWMNVVPDEPALPQEVQDFILAMQGGTNPFVP